MNARSQDQEIQNFCDYKPAPVISVVGEKRMLTLLVSGLALLIISILWDTYNHLGIPSHSQDSELPIFFQAITYIYLLKEVAFAILIAFILILANERISHDRQMESALRIQRNIAQEVFRGIFGINTPRDLVNEAIATIFQAPLIRRNAELDLKCRVLPATSTLNARPTHFVVEIYFAYDLENASSVTIPGFIPLVYDIYNEPDLRNLSRVCLAEIGDQVYKSQEDLRKFIVAAPAHSLRDGLECVYAFPFTLPPGDSIKVAFRYEVVKGIGDSEVWTNVYPTMDARITLDLVSQDQFEYGVRARHRDNVELLKASTNMWHLTTPLLPYQAVVVWWRPKLESADASGVSE